MPFTLYMNPTNHPMSAISMFEVRKENCMAGKWWSQDSNPGRLVIECTMAALCSSYTGLRAFWGEEMGESAVETLSRVAGSSGSLQDSEAFISTVITFLRSRG